MGRSFEINWVEDLDRIAASIMDASTFIAVKYSIDPKVASAKHYQAVVEPIDGENPRESIDNAYSYQC